MRIVYVVVLLAVGCCGLLYAWGALQNLFGYRDSPVSTYLLIGLPSLAVALAAFVAAWRLAKR